MSGDQMISAGKLFRVRVNTNDKTQIAFVPFERFTIGSLASLPVVINDPSVAKKHLVVSVVNNDIYITDQNSASGTRVNGFSIPANVPHLYQPGDRIMVGKVEYSLQIHLFEQVDATMQKIGRDENLETEKEKILFAARNEAEEIVRLARYNAVKVAEKSAEDILKRAHSDSVAVRAKADADGQQILERKRLEGLREVEAIVVDARAQAEQAFEGHSLEFMKVREQKMQEAIQHAHDQAAEILNQARQEALRIHHEANLRAAQERGVDASKILAEATIEAAGIKEAAHKAAQEGLKNLYKQAVERADEVIRAREMEADKIIAGARAVALEIKTKAQEEFARLTSQAVDQVHDIRAKALLNAEEILAHATARANDHMALQEVEADKMLEHARSVATGFVLQSQREVEMLQSEVKTNLSDSQTSTTLWSRVLSLVPRKAG